MLTVEKPPTDLLSTMKRIPLFVALNCQESARDARGAYAARGVAVFVCRPEACRRDVGLLWHHPAPLFVPRGRLLCQCRFLGRGGGRSGRARPTKLRQAKSTSTSILGFWFLCGCAGPHISAARTAQKPKAYSILHGQRFTVWLPAANRQP